MILDMSFFNLDSSLRKRYPNISPQTIEEYVREVKNHYSRFCYENFSLTDKEKILLKKRNKYQAAKALRRRLPNLTIQVALEILEAHTKRSEEDSRLRKSSSSSMSKQQVAIMLGMFEAMNPLYKDMS